MDFPLRYCPNGWQRLERLREFYDRRPQEKIYARMEVPSQALKRFGEQYAHGPTTSPELDERVAFWGALLAERTTVRDDSIPASYLNELDQDVYGGIVGDEVRFMAHPENGWISSRVPLICRDWDDFDRPTINRQRPWFQFYRRELEKFRKAAEGKFGISHFILIESLSP